ncbi:MAG: dicarboxylate/amino acid:cation symporter [Planctomycetota bacterium]
MRRLALHWWILIAMVLGVATGWFLVAQWGDDGAAFAHSWIRPIGSLFLNLLRMIAVPLVLFSLTAGVAKLRDTAKLGRMGGRTLLLYIGTTAVAITIGLGVALLLGPGKGMPQGAADSLRSAFRERAQKSIDQADQLSVLEQIVGIVPTNPFAALASAEMLQVVFFALMLGIALTRLGGRRDDVAHVVQVFDLLSDAIIEMVQIIMRIAPIGVFALLASTVAELGKDGAQLEALLAALLLYMAAVVIGLALHVFVTYGLILRLWTPIGLSRFLRAMLPAQLLAFSSSSSAATLPVTLRCVERELGVDEEASSFVLPLGATVNMDGTALYQGVAAMFIANAYGLDLTMGQMLEIVLTATLASIGTAAVPGVGLVMLTIVLKQVGVPLEGIALILGVDRILDMCRTVVNITGDAAVCTVVAAKEGLLHPSPPGSDR